MNWQLELAEAGRRGAPIGLLYGPHFDGSSARRAARAIADALGKGVYVVPRSAARKNPTLVHHGIVRAARWHVTGVLGAALADLYVDDVKTAKRIAAVFADWTKAPVNLLDNRKTPPTLTGHPRKTVSHVRRNPDSSGNPLPGEVWTDWRNQERCRIISVHAGEVKYSVVGSGDSLYLSLGEFRATHKPPRGSRVNPKGRNPRDIAGEHLVDFLGGLAFSEDGKTAKTFSVRDAADRFHRSLMNDGDYEVLKHGARFVLMYYGPLPRANPSRSKAARARRQTRREDLMSRRIRRSYGSGRKEKSRYYATHQAERSYARRHPARNPKGRELSVFDRHQLKIARDTLKMSDAGARIMGGPTKAEAREIIIRLTGRAPKENPRGPRIVYNRLLGGWYVVTGPHQTPLNGRFNSKAEAQAWLAGGGRRPNPKGRKRNPEYQPSKRLIELGAKLIGGFGFRAMARDVRTGKESLEHTLRSLVSVPGFVPESGRVILRTALDAVEREKAGRPQMTVGEMAAVKAEAMVAHRAQRERLKPNPKRPKRGRRLGKGSRMSRPRSNPRRSNRAEALSTYRRLNQVEPGPITKVSAPRGLNGTAVRIGELHSLVYSSDKYAGQKDNPHGKTQLYEHRTKRPRPVLATDASGREVHIVGGRMHPTPDGLVN
jgi:hypothetical protein